jgi:hypothetical protein
VKTRLGPRGIGLPSVLVCSLVAVSGPARSLLGRTPLVFFAISAVTSSCPIATGIGQYISMLLPGLQQQTRREAHPDYAVATVPPLQRWSGRQRSQRSCRSPASPYHQRYFCRNCKVVPTIHDEIFEVPLLVSAGNALSSTRTTHAGGSPWYAHVFPS